MSHAIYQTKAIILKTKNMRESNKLVYLYTEKFGLIYANLQAGRELRSKMRYHAHPQSLVWVDLVAGKNIWRVTGVHEYKSSYELARGPWYGLAERLSQSILRLCKGEEEHKGLWDYLEYFYHNIFNQSLEQEPELEISFMVAFLKELGYWHEKDDFSLDDFLGQERILFIKNNKADYIKKINMALVESQL